ncbi:MAG: regulatory signaling modulator protein AmpE [Gammaproteobacteria bacterium]|nr:regulatory signaling modulator protein AmpE [Gammaproteobacteria bacterium]
MNFLALLLGLALERVLTHLFHLREFRWLDPLFDSHLRRLRATAGGRNRRWSALALTLLLMALLVAPVALLSGALAGELLQIPYFLFAVVILLFSLGPRDLDDEVEDYGDALETGDVATQQSVAEELLEKIPPVLLAERNEAVERAIYVQANNRIFGVVFWFLVLGPTGAWAFRVLDLLRHRTEVKAGEEGATATMEAVRTLHGLLAWIPSRLLALGYVLAGNFEEAMESWRNSGREAHLPFAECTAEIVARVGVAASGRGALDVADTVEALDRIRGARSLVIRTLWMIWCPVIAVLTLYEWLT